MVLNIHDGVTLLFQGHKRLIWARLFTQSVTVQLHSGGDSREGVKGQRRIVHSLNLRAKITRTHTGAKKHGKTQLCNNTGKHTLRIHMPAHRQAHGRKIHTHTNSLRPKQHMNLRSLAAAPKGKNKKVLLCPSKCLLKLSIGSREDKTCPSHSYWGLTNAEVTVTAGIHTLPREQCHKENDDIGSLQKKTPASSTLVSLCMYTHSDNSAATMWGHKQATDAQCPHPWSWLAVYLISFAACGALWSTAIECMEHTYRHTHSNIGCCCSYNYQIVCVLLCCVQGRTLDSGAICTVPLLKQLQNGYLRC